jgi:hypothetical protein
VSGPERPDEFVKKRPKLAEPIFVKISIYTALTEEKSSPNV